MKKVKDILAAKGRQVWTVKPDATVFQALERMAEKNVGALVVLDGERLIGVLSERDYARKIILEGRTSRQTRVREIMSDEVICVDAERTIEECMAVMTHRRIRHLPVLEGDRLAGVISIGDVVNAIISEQQNWIRDLEDYITVRR
jgi:CBS domain-containing protein